MGCTMAGIRLILHGKVAGDPEVREAVLCLRKEGHLVEVSVTREGGDAARLTGEAVADAQGGHDLVIRALCSRAGVRQQEDARVGELTGRCLADRNQVLQLGR